MAHARTPAHRRRDRRRFHRHRRGRLPRHARAPGRQAGHADFFTSHVAEHGIEACDYLLAVDVDMNPLPGYHFTNWDTGYGDFVCRPDYATARLIPWLEGTAMVLCDLTDEEGVPVEVSPRQILRRQLERAAERGLRVCSATELEFFLFQRLLRGGRRQGLEGPDAAHVDDRGLPAAADHTRGVRPAPHPQRDARCRHPRRVLQGRGGTGPARGERHLRRGARHGRPPPGVQERDQGDRRPGGHEPPRSWPSGRWTTSVRPVTCTPACGTLESGEPAHGRRVAPERPVDGRASLPGRPAALGARSWPGVRRRRSTPTGATCPAAGPPRPPSRARTTGPAASAWSGTAPAAGWSPGSPGPT